MSRDGSTGWWQLRAVRGWFGSDARLNRDAVGCWTGGHPTVAVRSKARKLVAIEGRRRGNGLLEGINSLVQAAKARARGVRSARKMKVIIYLLLSKLDFKLPNTIPSAIHAK